MSVPSRCITIGVLVFLYWVVAFLVAFMSHFAAVLQIDVSSWWNLGWLRVPGLSVGMWVYEFLEMLPGWDYAAILGWPLYIALFISAVAMGTGAWLLSALVTGWWLRRKRS